ncbi:MAG: hypothetical protein AAF433_05240 [Bacteroidota bacterium]
MLTPFDFKAGRRNLIAVLDWGLGHASRSLALAQRLRMAGEQIVWTSAGPALEMIRRETNGEDTYVLPAYAIRYGSQNMYWNMARQLPKLQRVVRAEKRVIETIVREAKIDRLISDNRFGCHSSFVPSIFLSHQLHPIVPHPISWIYRRFLRPFNAFWVPDLAHPNRLSGRLSAAEGFNNVHYLGYLSRLPLEEVEQAPFKVGVLLSGPEPQRSLLEEKILPLLSPIPGQHQLIRGLAASRRQEQRGSVFIQDFADGPQVAALLRNAQLVVARSGYSSLMDMRSLGVKRALLIPTPGQTEQIYLAKRAQEWSHSVSQHQLQLSDLLANLA